MTRDIRGQRRRVRRWGVREVSPLAASTLDIYSEEDWADEPALAAAIAWWKGDDSVDMAKVADGLIELANAEDEVAEDAMVGSEFRRIARASRDGLTRAAQRVREVTR